MRNYMILALSSLLLFGAMPALAAPTLLEDIDTAIAKDDFKSFEKILPHLKNVDETFNKLGETPLTLAASNGRYEMVEALAKRGANVNHQTRNGYSALIFAAMNEHQKTDNAVKTVRILLAAGANKSLRNAEGKSAYDMAVDKKATELINLLR